MATGRAIAIALVAATVAAVLISPIASIVATNSGQQTVSDYNTTVTVNTTEDLEGYNADPASVDVLYDNGTAWVSATEGTDYQFHPDNASVSWLSGGNLSNGDTVGVSYDWQATQGSTTTVVQLTPMFVGLLILGVLAGKIQQMM